MVPRPKGRGEQDPKGSGIDSLGQFRVFWRDAPESFESDPLLIF